MAEFTEPFVSQFYIDRGTSRLTAEGLQLVQGEHRRLTAKVSAPVDRDRMLYLTGGLPGSGKGGIVHAILKANPSILLVDPDLMKSEVVDDLVARFPGLKQAITSSTTWASVVHEASSLCAKRLCTLILQDATHDLLYDATMAGASWEWYQLLCSAASAQGYFVLANICTTPAELCLQRAATRATKEVVTRAGHRLQGRAVPKTQIEASANQLPKNIVEYQCRALYGSCSYLYPGDRRLQLQSTYWKEVSR